MRVYVPSGISTANNNAVSAAAYDTLFEVVKAKPICYP
jgi:hypothetical protein